MARRDPLAHLGKHAVLSASLQKEVRALGPAAAPALLAMFTAPGADVADSPEELAAANAALFLSASDANVGAAFLEVLARDPVGGLRLARASYALRGAGARCLEPVLALLANADAARWPELVDVALHLGEGPLDPRVQALLIEAIERVPTRAAPWAEARRDHALLPALRAAFDRRVAGMTVERDDLEAATALLAAALRIGGEDLPRLGALKGAAARYAERAEATIAELRQQLVEAEAIRDSLRARAGQRKRGG